MKRPQTNSPLLSLFLGPLLLPALALIFLAGGCSSEQSTHQERNSDSNAAATPVVARIQTDTADARPAVTTSQTVDTTSPAPQETPSTSNLIDKTKRFFGDAAEKGTFQVPDAKSMVGELFGDLRQSTEQSAGDSMTITGDAVDWANETFQSLKDQGVTSASNTGDWLTEDWSNMESWEYKIEPLESPTDVAELEKQLNELGKRGWECFHIDSSKMMFKKPRQSYLKRLPFKDLLRLAPLLNQEK